MKWKMSMQVGTSSYLNEPNNSWWSTQTTKVKILLVACGITSTLTLVFIICTIALALKGGDAPTCPVAKDSSSDKECNTQACKEIAHQLKMYMDESVNPCDDFYAFACGGSQYIFEENEFAIGLAIKKLTAQVAEIFSTYKPEEQENKAYKSVLHVYQKCMKEGSNARGSESIQNLIGEVLGTDLPMAVGKSWKENEFNLFQSMGKIIRLDPAFFLQLLILPDNKNYTLLAPWLAPFEPVPANVPENLKDIVCLLYPNCTSDETVQEDIKNIIDNMKGVSKSCVNIIKSKMQWHPKVMMSDAKTATEMGKFGLKDMAREVLNVTEASWKEFFETLFSGTDLQIDDEFRITTMLDCLRIFPELVKDKRVLANIIGLRLIQVWGPLYSSTIGSSLNPSVSRQETCMGFVDKYLGFALAKMHTDKHLASTVIPEVTKMKDEIQEGFRQLLNSAGWLDEGTRNKALQKLNNMDSLVVFPEWVLNKITLEDHYKDVEPVATLNFVEGSRLASTSYFKKQVNQLMKPLDKKNFWPAIAKDLVNAFYFPYSNSMFYMRGIVMKPFYASNRPRSVKFGAFGHVVGHEITHGFDSQGKAYDHNGQVNNWWDEETETSFKKGADCFVKQYYAVKDDGADMSIDGNNTLAENIADNGGLRAAYQAYKLSTEEDMGKLAVLKNYTDDQLFFISAAQFWCTNHNAEFIKNQIKTDTHSPNKYRALVPYWNFPEFSKAFNCKEGSTMNPKEKCRIW